MVGSGCVAGQSLTRPQHAAMAKKKAGKGGGKAPPSDIVPIMRNRKLHHDYEVIRSFEAGLVLAGSEVKSLRNGDVQLGDAHGRLDDNGELWLYGLHIGEYRQAGYAQHLAAAPRKLLLNRQELDSIAGTIQAKGLTIALARLYFKKGWAKAEVSLVRGKAKADKRTTLKNRATQRDAERELARHKR